MTWRKRNLSTYSRYNVEVSTTKIEESSLLQDKSKKGLAYSVVKKFSALVTVVMIMVVAFSGVLTTAPDAKAWGVSDIMRDAQNAFCSSAPLGYKTDDKGFQAPKAPKNSKQMTAYEKYGMSATSFSTWSGFNPEKGGGMDEANGNGEASTRGIINATGGNAKKSEGESKGTNMVEWGEKWNGKESEFPGLFNLTGECGGLSFRSAGSIGANMIFSFSKTATWIAGFSYEAAADINSTIFKTMEKPVNKIVKTLKDKLYFAYLTPIIMLGALWMAYVGLVKRQSTQVLSGVIWMIGAVAASVAMMTSPMMLPKLVNDTVGGISANAMGVITSAGSTNGKGELCYAPPTKGESKSTNSVRTVQCNLWYSFVYTPFSLGQFGYNPKELTKHEAKLDSETKTQNSLKSITDKGSNIIYDGRYGQFYALKNPSGGGDTKFGKLKLGDDKVVDASEQNFALAWIDFKSNWDNNPTLNYTKTSSLVNIAVNQLSPEKYNADFRGDNVGNRVTMALVALVSAGASGLMIIILSIALIILDLGLIILALVFPLFALAALHPGEGRKIAMGWVELVCKIALRRIVGSVYLATLILVFSVLMTAGLAWAMSMILMIAIAAAGLVYYKKIDGAFSSFSLGGKPMEMPGAQTGEKFVQGLKSNAAAAATGGRMGHNSVLGRSLQGKQQAKQWEKRLGGGAGNTPQSKDKATENTNSSASAGAGATPTRKELREAQRAEARERTLNGSTSNPELEEGQQALGGAGEEPQLREVDSNNQIPQPELDGRDYENELEGYEAGAGEEPQSREIDETDVPTAELPEGTEQEQMQEGIDSGAGNQPQSYRDQVTAHSGYEGSAVARKDARIEKNKQRALNVGNKVGEKVAPIARSAKEVAGTHAGIGKFYATNSARELRNNLGSVAVGAKEMAGTGKFYAVNSVRELRDNLKNGVQGQVRVAKGKVGQISEAQKNKRIDKQLNKIQNGKAFEGAVYARRHAEADVNKQMVEAKARRERIMAPVKAVGTSASGIVTRQATVAGNAIASGASVAGGKVVSATQAGATVARVRATQGMEATRERLSQIPESVKNKTVVAYQENRAVKKLDKLNLADVKREHKADKQQFNSERKAMQNDIASKPRALRAQYAEQTYGTNAKGNAVNGQAPAIANKYVPPAIRAQEARAQEKQAQEKQALKEQKNAGGTQRPRPVESNSAPRPNQSAPRPNQSAPRPVEGNSAPRPNQSAPRPVEGNSAPRPNQTAPRPVEGNPTPRPNQSASRSVDAPKKSSPQPAKKETPPAPPAPRPVDKASSTPRSVESNPTPRPNQSVSRSVDAPKKSSPQPAKKETPPAPPTPKVDRTSPAKNKVEPKPPTGSSVRPSKEPKVKNDTVPPRASLSRSQGNTQAPQVPPRNPLNKGKSGK